MKISVITPSLNQGSFIERTIESVARQSGNFDVEHIIIDGASTDNTLDILRRHETEITWQSEKDEGQSDALNKGLRMASGDILCWLNSDDIYADNALSAVVAEYDRKPFEWCFGNCRIIDEDDNEIRRGITRYKLQQARRYSYSRLLRRNFISQPAAFFTRTAYEEVGGIDPSLHYAMDYDFFLRLAARHAPRFIDKDLADFRWHSESKCGETYGPMALEAYECAKRHAPDGTRWDLFLHYLHYRLLRILYPML